MTPPHWADVVGWVFLGLGFGSALVIVADELLPGRRQHMAVMNVVHPITALYLGPVWLWAYFRYGRKGSVGSMHTEVERLAREGADPGELRRQAESSSSRDLSTWHVASASSHCGAGCTLGDIVGEWIIFATGWTIAGVTLYAELILDFVLAWSFGIVFQYFTIVPMRRNLSRLEGLWLAIRADTLSILSFQLGLFGWMALSAKVIWQPPLPIDSSAHWWMMQVGMILGYLTTWPVNRWLIQKGWKEKMDPRKHLAAMLESRGPQRRGVAEHPSPVADSP